MKTRKKNRSAHFNYCFFLNRKVPESQFISIHHQFTWPHKRSQLNSISIRFNSTIFPLICSLPTNNLFTSILWPCPQQTYQFNASIQSSFHFLQTISLQPYFWHCPQQTIQLAHTYILCLSRQTNRVPHFYSVILFEHTGHDSVSPIFSGLVNNKPASHCHLYHHI